MYRGTSMVTSALCSRAGRRARIEGARGAAIEASPCMMLPAFEYGP